MGKIRDTLASLLSNLNKTLVPFSSLSNSTMARQTKNAQKYFCDQCKKKFTRKFDVKRHQKIHLVDEPLRQEKHSCPITETGCEAAMLQLSNVKAHIKARHIDVLHLMCFDCRPAFRRFHDTVALADHVQLEHPLIQKRTSRGPPKPCRKVVKQPQDTVSPLPHTPSDNSDIFPLPPTGRFPLPPSAPPLQKSTVELPDFITISPSAFLKDDPESPRSPSHPRTVWYRATQNQLALYKKARDACRIERGRQLPSPVPSSSTTGEDSESSWSCFPSPPPTSRLIASASAFDRLPSPHSSDAPSRSSTPPYTTHFIRDDTEARRCHLPTRRSPAVHKKTRYISGMERARQLHSPAPSSSSTGEGSGSSWSRFPSPPPPPPTSWRFTPASTFNNRLPSPSSSGASSRPSTPPYTTRVIRTDTEARWVSPRVWPAVNRLQKSDSEMKK
ncbi:hypothetical protein ARMGADRAFT_1062608 [Armillaria gallica]|uniref:C2H2-type domain-containing protein n=1 Tax=Armillaria gallica TaxID=47427 RepID=A0A2H3DGY4_ARMGA|nr:hypothetical protein ARMGADRAFT_1062608 [Armillaria gallica]